jgi:hypothetical protein
MYTKEQLMNHAATCMMNDELTEPEALTPLQSLSIADLIGLRKLLLIRINSTNSTAQYDEGAENLSDLTTELRRRYSTLFPNNKHFTP